MARARSPYRRSKGNYRVRHTFCEKTTLRSSESRPSKKIFDKVNKAYGQGNIFATKLGCYRALQGKRRVPIADVSHPKRKREGAPNFRSSEVKSVSKPTQISTRKSKFCPQIFTTERLHGKIRHFSSIFSRPNQRKPSPLSGFRLQDKNISNDIPSFWPFKCSVNFLKNQQVDSKCVKIARGSSACLSRRFPFCKSRSKDSRVANGSSCRPPSEPGMVGKFREINFEPHAKNRVSGGCLGYALKHGKPTRSEDIPVGKGSRGASQSSPLELEVGDLRIGPTRICLFGNSAREIIYQKHSKSMLQVTRGKPDLETSNTRGSDRGPDVVEGKLGSARTNLYPRAEINDHFRCFRFGMGGTDRRSDYVSRMDQGSKSLAHKPKRVICGIYGPRSISRCSEGAVSYGTVRQQNSSGLFKKSRRDKIANTLGSNQRVTNLSLSSRSESIPCVPTGPLQFNRGFSVSRNEHSRMAPRQFGHNDDFSKDGHSSGRSFCVESFKGSPTICHHGRHRSGSVIRECVQPKMDLQPSVGFSTPSTHSQGSPAPKRCVGLLSTGSAEVGKSLLESRPQEEGDGSPATNSQLGSPPERSVHRRTSAESKRTIFRGLEGTGWNDLIADLHPDDMSLLELAWRESTWKTYCSAWKQWTSWCKQNGVKSGDPRPQNIASYLGYLFRVRKLAYSTILVHKSAIICLSDPGQNKRLTSHPLVTSILKAINLQGLKNTVSKPEIWNIQDLFGWIENHPPDKASIFQVSRHVALLLLLASGRRIHDLTLLNIDKEHLERAENSITFWPVFGSKTDSAKGRQSGWFLVRSDNPLFDLVGWIDCLIEVSEKRRRAAGLKNLFITTRGKVRAASRAIIAGWLKTAFTDLGLQVTPGSIRSAVASYDYENNVPLDHILKRGNWRGSTNFFKHYCKSVNKPCTNVKDGISTLFKAI